jgi:hypothetical protein
MVSENKINGEREINGELAYDNSLKLFFAEKTGVWRASKWSSKINAGAKDSKNSCVGGLALTMFMCPKICGSSCVSQRS